MPISVMSVLSMHLKRDWECELWLQIFYLWILTNYIINCKWITFYYKAMIYYKVFLANQKVDQGKNVYLTLWRNCWSMVQWDNDIYILLFWQPWLLADQIGWRCILSMKSHILISWIMETMEYELILKLWGVDM